MQKAFHSSQAPQFPQLAQKTFAAFPVWSGSTRAPVKSQPINRRDRARIMYEAEKLERRTAVSRRDAFGKVSTQGALGRAGLDVLRAMLFKFHNVRTGQLDPSRASIAAAAGYSVRHVARVLLRLKGAGILSWVRRCADRMEEGRYVLEQISSAYGIALPSQWRGAHAVPDTPPPDPDAWGACPALPSLGIMPGDGARRMQTVLEAATPGSLGDMAARLGRRRLSL
jgi:AraC-like DNA-binding protein